jgi:tetratricopeptide (TPR) repeat protein
MVDLGGQDHLHYRASQHRPAHRNGESIAKELNTVPRRKAASPAAAFNATLRTALEHYADAVWLGRNSVLATPYVLGRHLTSAAAAANPRVRGEVLQGLIRDSAAEQWPGPLPATAAGLMRAANDERLQMGTDSPRYHFLLLDVRYLRQYHRPNSPPISVKAMPAFVSVSETRFFVHLEQAIEALSKLLLGRIEPSVRLEQPGPPPELVGRDAVLAAVLAELPGRRSVAISGVGGIGKSSLGAAVLAGWPAGAGLWYTFHTGLNDDLSSLLFSIGHFLNQHGRSTLWLQLLSGEGKLDNVAQALGFLRQDLELVAPDRPLFCFDEVDTLHTAEGVPRRRSHIQLLEFLESLRGLVSLLLIGQRALVDTDAHYALPPLSRPEMEHLLATAGVQLNGRYLARLHRFTQGNPRLLILYIALHRSGEDLTDVIELPRAPSARPLFNRLWKRLDRHEQEVLTVLAAFRSEAPQDAWRHAPAPLNGLIERRLVTVDLAGGLALQPFFRELVWLDLAAAQREKAHQQAAAIRAERGQYTEAAYHYWQAADPETAVRLWYAHQDEETRRGQAGAAAEVFQNIPAEVLPPPARRQLRVIQNRLDLLEGRLERVASRMQHASWHPDEEITADAYGQWATAARHLGQAEKAAARESEAIATLARLANKIAQRYHAQGLTYIQMADVAGARHQAQVAQYDVSSLLGVIEFLAGNYGEAQAHYQTALELARSADDPAKIAAVNYSLAMIAGRQGEMDRARQHAEEAILTFEKTGNRLSQESVRAELAGMYLNVRQFEQVIEPSERALRFFSGINHQRWISSICNNLAEAYLETGRLEKAKEYVHRVLQLEFPESRPNAMYTLGLIQQQEGDHKAAEAAFLEGIRVAQANSNRFLEAYLQRELGKLYCRLGEDGRAVEPLQTAAGLFEQMGLAREAAETRELL